MTVAAPGLVPRVLSVPTADSRERIAQLTPRIQRWLLEQVGLDADLARGGSRLNALIDSYVDGTLAREGTLLSRADRARLLESLTAELFALGPIEPLLRDDTVTEIMVNGPHQVWVEREGRIEETAIRFDDDAHVRRIIERIIAPLGRRCDESSPMVDARLPDGSRVNAIIPPLSLVGPILTIRKFARVPLTMQRLVELGALTPAARDVLHAFVRGAANVLISGGTGSGKTTLLNALSSFIPAGERIITIEDAAELRLAQRHVLSLEARPANAEGAGAVLIRQLLVNALRMRPDRIVVGECRAAETLDMLQAMNTGHDGSMTTVHANSPRDALARLESMVLMAGVDLPHRAIREQIASALQLVVQVERWPDGSRRITEIAEVAGLDGDRVQLTTLFKIAHSGPIDGTLRGALRPTGAIPAFNARLKPLGLAPPDALFQDTGAP